ncbi:hypothetical protein SLS61_005400 [Didymella pomorum]
MAKKKEASSEASATISTSRYTSPPVTLRVGADLESFYVPEFLLQSLNDLPRSGKTGRVVNLPDVDVDTGHIIVHFLHTAQYQTLPNSEEETAADHSKADFKKAIAAFIAAKKYGLATLRGLAKDRVFKLAETINIIQAAHGIGKDTLAALQEDAGWLQDLVLRKAEQKFAESDELFSSASFYNGINSLELAKFLGQRVAELYRSRFRQMREQLDPFGVLIARDGVEEVVEDTSHEPGEAVVEDVPSASYGSEATKEGVSISQASDPWIQAGCATIETATQPEGESHANGKDIVNGFVAVAEPDAEAVFEAENGFGIAEHPPISDGPDACEPTPDTIPTSSEVDPSLSKKWLEAHYIAKTGPFQGIKSKKARSMLWKKLKTEAAARLVEEREEATAGKMNEEPKTVEMSAEDTADAMQAVLTENEREVNATDSPAIDPFAGLSKLQRKKLEKQMKEEAAAKEKQSKKCVTEEVAIGPDLIEPGQVSAVDMDVLDDDHCPFRSVHLAQNAQWKDCSKCQAYTRKIAIKLHAAGMPDIDELVAR